MLLPTEPRKASPEPIAIRVPNACFTGRKSSSPPVSVKQAITMLGHPKTITTSSWRTSWHYHRLGVLLQWETPVVMYRFADIDFVPAGRLVEMRWSGLGIMFVKRWD